MSNTTRTDIEAALSYRPVRPEDLELLLAWRSNPRVFGHFRGQEAPLDWEEHLAWFGSRPPDRHDYVIEYNGRRVGSIFLTPDSFVGVYVGELSLWGEGIGGAAVEWLCTTYDRDAFLAEVHEENEGSRRLFEDQGFSVHDREGDWLIYRRVP
jgi:RimJ/RimL family protein N-acetyltransferase